jgi:hypothetical protein
MIKLWPLTPPDYRKNQEKAGDLPTCVICGRGIKAQSPKMVHLHDGGSAIVTETEAAELDAAGDMYFYPIGPECLRNHPEIKDYVRK